MALEGADRGWIPDHDTHRRVHDLAAERLSGNNLRLFVDDQYLDPGDPESPTFFGEPWMYVAPGEHHVTVDVVRGDPCNFRCAVRTPAGHTDLSSAVVEVTDGRLGTSSRPSAHRRTPSFEL